jgi:hypothetical protein
MTSQTGAAVRIYRPRNYRFQLGQDRYLSVFIDHQERGELWTNQVRTFDVGPGRHEVRLGTSLHRSRSMSFEVDVGQTADFACPRFWSSVGWARLHPATEKDLAGIAKLRSQSPLPRNLADKPPSESG